MSLTMQIRRSLFSVLALVAFGAIAATQGEAATGALPPSMGSVAACPNAEIVEPTPAPAEVVRHDWRARLPATIARSRS